MPQIRVTASQIRAKSEQLRGMNSNFKSQMQTLMSQANTLSSQWEGQANKAFMAAFRRDADKMGQFGLLMDKYVLVMDAIATAYEQAEAAATAIANSRTYAGRSGGNNSGLSDTIKDIINDVSDIINDTVDHAKDVIDEVVDNVKDLFNPNVVTAYAAPHAMGDWHAGDFINMELSSLNILDEPILRYGGIIEPILNLSDVFQTPGSGATSGTITPSIINPGAVTMYAAPSMLNYSEFAAIDGGVGFGGGGGGGHAF